MWPPLRTAIVAVTIASIAQATAGAQQRAETGAPDDPRVARVRAELLALWVEMAAAVGRGDRVALERMYAPEYVFIHSSGFETDRATHITDQLAADPAARAAFAAAAADSARPSGPGPELRVYGDVAVTRARNPTPGGRLTSNTTLYVERGGRWQFLQTQGTLLQPRRVAVPVSDALLDAYVGEYELRGGGRLSVRREGAGLVVRGVPVPYPRALTPVADTLFYDKLGFALAFARGADGRVTHLIARWGSNEPGRYERRP